MLYIKEYPVEAVKGGIEIPESMRKGSYAILSRGDDYYFLSPEEYDKLDDEVTFPGFKYEGEITPDSSHRIQLGLEGEFIVCGLFICGLITTTPLDNSVDTKKEAYWVDI